MKKMMVMLLALYSVAAAGTDVSFGFGGDLGLGLGVGAPGSNMFDGAYAFYNSPSIGGGGSVGFGLTLGTMVANKVGFSTGAYYRCLLRSFNIYSNAASSADTIKAFVTDNSVTFPALIRIGIVEDRIWAEAGVQLGMPFSASASLRNKRLGISDRYSDFRPEYDLGIILGVGYYEEGSFRGFRLFIPTAMMDTQNTIPGAVILSLAFDIPYKVF
ncbi:MAG: hypothetical protein FWC23_01850 [Chitinispirillia bacterium]|nr:hypothetical protein [Chitinispirillia bacterium]MCL2267921.1 hypothetical protein [Chitinispirillia bacterium]